ncbi:MAG: TetR/AcrR family transcriptional regulator [Leptospiraceae bacterium]|nr:TetR/AcrR family transcriptional regulator [Leptospiraceae bacterium]MCP5499982.1 TetR/AcrR family transcriptional regulator [Leptospiraceae bacterium]
MASKSNRNLKAYHHGDLRNALIDSALVIIAEEGYESLSLRKVAEKADVSPGAPYRHFKNSESLISAVAEVGFYKLNDIMEKIIRKRPRNYLWQFRECGLSYVEFSLDNSELFRIMYGNMIKNHSSHEGLKKAGEQLYFTFEGIIKNAQTENLLRAGNTREIALSAWSLVHGISNLIVEKQLFFETWEIENLRKMVKRQLSLLYNGIQPA